jgi:phage gp16-like protein
MISPAEIRKRQLAQIHIAKHALGLDDDTYRTLLIDVTGQDSSAKLNAKQRAAVLERFESRGWKNNKQRGKPVNVAPEKAPLITKIGALLADMKLSWAYSIGILKKMNIETKRLEWCTTEQLHDVAVVLIKRQEKLRKQAEKMRKQTCANSQTDTNA